MANGYDMYDPGFNSNTIRNNDKHSTYFKQDEDTGEYVLKDGYEQRYLGSGDNVASAGAESTFSNDYDDMWDSYEPNRDKKIYGIYKIPEQSTETQAPPPIEAVEAEVASQPQQNAVLSNRAAEAVAKSKAYETVFLPRQGSYMIGGDESVLSDFDDAYKLNLRKAKAPQPAQGESQSASSYAKNYKLSVGDTLTSNNNFI